MPINNKRARKERGGWGGGFLRSIYKPWSNINQAIKINIWLILPLSTQCVSCWRSQLMTSPWTQPPVPQPVPAINHRFPAPAPLSPTFTKCQKGCPSRCSLNLDTNTHTDEHRYTHAQNNTDPSSNLIVMVHLHIIQFFSVCFVLLKQTQQCRTKTKRKCP